MNDIVKIKMQYRNSVKMCSLLAISAAVLSVGLTYLSMQKPDVKYYATTRSGMDIPMVAMSTPLVTPQYILEWSSIATRKVLNLNFSSIDTDIENARPYFTGNGYSAFTNVLKNSGLFQDVVQKHLIISAVAGRAIITGTGVANGKYFWNVQIPLLETIQTASTTVSHNLVANLRVSRVPSLESVQGVAIDNFSISRSGG